jgi:hypothetical protein
MLWKCLFHVCEWESLFSVDNFFDSVFRRETSYALEEACFLLSPCTECINAFVHKKSRCLQFIQSMFKTIRIYLYHLQVWADKQNNNDFFHCSFSQTNLEGTKLFTRIFCCMCMHVLLVQYRTIGITYLPIRRIFLFGFFLRFFRAVFLSSWAVRRCS